MTKPLFFPNFDIECKLFLNGIKKNAIIDKSVSTIEATHVYPNPAKDLINIETGEPFKEIVIYNSFGQKVIQKEFSDNTNPDRISLDVSELAEGVYVLSISSDKESLSTKMIIKD